MAPPLEYRSIRTSRIRHRYYDEGSGPAVVLLHGFPEGAYSWRHQIPALVDAGFRAIAPDQRGYAGSTAPASVEDYDQVELAADVVALLDALGLERAVIVGHDWGAPVAWHTALLHPERVSAVVAMSVAYGGRAPARPLDIMRRRAGDSFFYMLHFQEPGVAEAELEADVSESLRRFYYSCSGDAPPSSFLKQMPRTATLFEAVTAPPGLPHWLSEEELAHYTASFRESGFFGPLNWYRNIDRTWERTASLEGKKVPQKALFIAGDRDPVLLFSHGATERMATVVPGLVGARILPGVGHWTQQEDPRTVNAELIAFLRSV